MIEKIKNKKVRVLLMLVCALILFMGASFAWLGLRINSSKTNVLKAGSLSLYLDESSTEGINLDYAIPTSDTKGLSQEGYTFQLVNNSNVATNYVIYLDDLDLEENQIRMPDSVVKYNLTKNGVEGETILLTAIGTNPQRVVDMGTIEANTTNTYTLKLWMDYDATTEVMDTYFYAQLRVEAEQENIKVDTSDMVMNVTDTDVTLDLEEDISNYTITSSDLSIATIDATTGVIIPKTYGTVTFTLQHRSTSAKKQITVTIQKNVTVTYMKQTGADSIEKESDSCILENQNQTGCSITLPSITASDSYSAVGWSEDKTSHTGKTGTINVSSDMTLYTITKKNEITYTATFVKQEIGIESIETEKLQCTIDSVYNDEIQATTCMITMPSITTTAGYTAIGWNEIKDSTTGIAVGEKIEIDSDKTYYTVIKKDAITYSAKFYKNGANSIDNNTVDYVTKSCMIDEVYNETIQENKCTVVAPSIEASSVTPIVVGYSENQNATVGNISVGQEITLTSDKEYYAITKNEVKTLTATFNLNGAVSQDDDTSSYITRSCNIKATYNGVAQESGCDITSPTIVASSATPTIIGYSLSADDHTSSWNQSTEKTINQDVVYYAQTKKNKVTYTATFKIGKNVSSIAKESDTCTIDATYNGISQATSCTIEGPSITPKEGYTSVGWSTESGAITGETTITLSKDTIFYANAVANSYTIEYYNGTDLVGTTGTKVDENVTLTTMADLGITKTGYNFKGWSKSIDSTTISYQDGEQVSNLSKESGSIVKLYAVWIDDIAPVCVFSNPSKTTTQNTTTLTVTCTDEGSGLASQTLTSDNFTINGSQYGQLDAVSSPVAITNGYRYELTLRGLSVGSFTVSLNSNSILDNDSNYNQKTTSETVTVEGRTYTVKYTKGDHISAISSTTDSCTTVGSELTCSINLPDITAETGYSILGWYEGNAKFGDANQQNAEISSDKELVAQAELKYYNFAVTISEGIESFDISGAEGTPLTNQTSYSYDNAYLTEITITNIKMKTGYTYKGYTLNGSLTEIDGSNNDTITIQLGAGDGSINLNSQINSYSVTYDYATNGGTSSTKTSATVNYNSAIDLTPTAAKSGYTFVGWNTSKDATTALSSLTMETSNVTLYAIYKKDVTITFNKNGAESQTVSGETASSADNVTVSCTLYNNGSCKVTSPGIEASSATPTVIGYSLAADDYTSIWNVSTEKEVKENATYYAQTKQDEVTKSVTYTKQGTGVTAIGSTSDSCSIGATYNGVAQEPSCKVTLPSITVATGYTAIGWNTSKDATTGTSAGTEISLSENTTTYYTISRKNEVTLTATFNKNGAESQTVSGGTASTAESVTVSCKLEEVYNMTSQATSCSITTPSITASTATPTVVGYAESKDATEASVQPNTSLTLSSNKTYYAITKSSVKTYTATFNKNGAESQTVSGGTASTADSVTQSCNIPITYNGVSQATSCTVTTPSITASTATPTVCGYTTTSTGTSTCSVKANTEISLSSNIDYYAQTYKAATPKNVVFKIAADSHVTQITSGTTSVTNTTDSLTETCNIAATYNGTSQATSCTVTSPTITVETGYKNAFWGTSESSTSGTASGGSVSSETSIYYARALTGNSYTVNYYDGTTLKSSSSATVGTSFTLKSASSMSLSKTGYTFKGWSNTSESSTVAYTDGQSVNNLTTTDGGVANLYAVWIDETSPSCSWSTPGTIYTEETTTLTLTCTDTGSGMLSQTLTTSNFAVSDSTYGSVIAVSSPTAVTNGYEYTITVKGLSSGSTSTTNGSFTVSLNANAIKDTVENYNLKVTSSAVTVKGKTYTLTLTKGDNVSSLSSTSLSCTSMGTNTTCDIELTENNALITPNEGYVALGWFEDTNNTTTPDYLVGSSITLSADTKLVAKARIANASEIEYDNSTSGLLDSSGNDCTDVQCAIDSISRMLAWIVLRK